jgi:hypothetical protein
MLVDLQTRKIFDPKKNDRIMDARHTREDKNGVGQQVFVGLYMVCILVLDHPYGTQFCMGFFYLFVFGLFYGSILALIGLIGSING